MFSLNAAAKRKTTALGGGRAALTAGGTTKGLSGTAPAQTTATKPPPRAFHANDSDSDDDDDRVPVKAAVISTRSAPLPTFADDDGDDDDMHGAVAMSDDDDAKATSGARHAQQQQQQQPQQPPPKRYGLQLSSAQLKETAEVQRAALREEATIFDYDAVYDHIKAAEQQQVLTREGISQRKESRYVNSMMQQAEERTKQKERIKERRMQRELEESRKELGDEQEVFVTDAYRKKQEELRLLEEQEAARDAKAGEGGTNFVGFYGNILNARESTAEAVRRTLAAGVVATAMVKDSGKSATTSVDEDRMRDTSMQSGSLGAGLNIIRKATVTQRERIQEHATRKSGTSGMMAPGHAASGGTSVAPVGGQQRTQQRDRLTQAFEKELVEHQREQELKRKREEEELREKYKRQTTEDAVAEAKRRAEERRKARLAKSTGSGAGANAGPG